MDERFTLSYTTLFPLCYCVNSSCLHGCGYIFVVEHLVVIFLMLEMLTLIIGNQ